jgi:catechol 1,2-dioxygenase
VNLRGGFTTDGDGVYGFYCMQPVSYPVSFDGPAGRMVRALDRHVYRPAHLHLIMKLR